MWSIKGNKWIVWKCYPSSVEVLANGGSVYVVLDHESRKRNSRRSENLAKLKMMQQHVNRLFLFWLHANGFGGYISSPRNFLFCGF